MARKKQVFSYKADTISEAKNFAHNPVLRSKYKIKIQRRKNKYFVRMYRRNNNGS